MWAQRNGKDLSMRKGAFQKREKRPNAQDEESLDLSPSLQGLSPRPSSRNMVLSTPRC